VIEVGLGGRLDSTNIITPLLSVITNISLDHTALLGHTLPEIASEKAGIIKRGIPVVVGRADGDVRSVFASRAAECQAPIDFAQDAPAYSEAVHGDDAILYRGTRWGDIKSQLTGDCQLENANTILHALAHLPFDLPADAVANGFGHVQQLTGLMGRWTTVATAPRVICDTGHNIGGWEYLAPRLTKIAADHRLHVVIGFVSDKDVSSIMTLLPSNANYYFPTPSVKRGMQSATLAATAAEHGIVGNHYDSVAEAFSAAKAAASPDDVIYVGGSTFVVADFLNIK
jgi:dihydrofolate synthase/folylpolyglutamate synthase